MGKLIDLTGQQFGRLLVIKRVENDWHNHTQWLCRCSCGNTCVVQAGKLRGGNNKSCGCLRKERLVAGDVRRKHNGRRTRLYRIWTNIKTRCLNINSPVYRYYGERGITIYEEWRDSFEAFRDWAMLNGYRDDLTIDRIDVNGSYEPSNCRWVTMKEQGNNRRSNHLLTYDGETHTIAEWARMKNIKDYTLRRRERKGWAIEKIFYQKPRLELSVEVLV